MQGRVGVVGGEVQAFSWLHTLPLPECPYDEFGYLPEDAARANALIRDIASIFHIPRRHCLHAYMQP